MVKFPLSFAAFTEVLIDVYIDQKFTQVSKLFYRGKNPKCKHGIPVSQWNQMFELSLADLLQSSDSSCAQTLFEMSPQMRLI